jgi:hypothetical protein
MMLAPLEETKMSAIPTLKIISYCLVFRKSQVIHEHISALQEKTAKPTDHH